MTAGPPLALERAVLWLVPPQVREEVAGDLWERYRSPLGYLFDLVRALPYVVASQIRRATDPALFMLIAFTLVAALGALEPERGEIGIPIPWRALAAALPCIVALLLRDAYRRNDIWSGPRAGGDVVWLGIALVLSQAATGFLAPDWGLPVGWLIGGFVFTSIVMALLRSGIELANTGLRPGLPAVSDPAEDFHHFRGNLRLRAVIETGALAVPAAAAAWFGLTADRPIVSFASAAWAAVTLMLIARRWWFGGAQAMPAAMPARQALAHYVGELERQRATKGLALWWYFAPLFAGIAFNTVAFGLFAQRPLAALTGSAACIVLALMIARVDRRQRKRLADKIAQLERSAGALTR